MSLVEGLEVVGIEERRGDIWKLIAKVRNQRSHYITDVYRKFLAEVNPRTDYKISKDVHRTVPGKALFKEETSSGENKLYNVLKAYSSYDPEIGYVQGINFISSILLQ